MNIDDFTTEDTVTAIAGGVGGAISVVRISGPEALGIGSRVWRGTPPLGGLPPRTAQIGELVDGSGTVIDRCLALVFPGPASYTGEDVVEFHTHGGQLVPRETLRAILAAGARMADPGEFTKRAFVNGKMDLAQAEAVGDLIGAHTAMALHLANRQLAGALSVRIGEIHAILTGLLADVESRLDFPEEDIDWPTGERLIARIREADGLMAELLRNRIEGEVLREGVRLVIAGTPNVGKSSLLNAILGRDRAIVTDIPGTTRDTLEELAHIRGIPVRLTDTAGIRAAGDIVERSGVDRSRASIREAQVVLWVYDATRPGAAAVPEVDTPVIPVLVVANKSDLLGDGGAIADGHIPVSALHGLGIDRLYDEIEKVVWDRPHASEPECAVSVRHRRLLESARAAVGDAAARVASGDWELASIALREGAESVGRITGKTASHDLLEDIFSRFCIGK